MRTGKRRRHDGVARADRELDAEEDIQPVLKALSDTRYGAVRCSTTLIRITQLPKEKEKEEVTE